MLRIEEEARISAVCRALGSTARLKALALLRDHPDMNASELASALGISGAAMTVHLQTLEEAGLITSQRVPGRGIPQKRCRLRDLRLLIDLSGTADDARILDREIPLGAFTEAEPGLACGLAGESARIGETNDPLAFLDPMRIWADLLWLGEGSVTYALPESAQEGETLSSLIWALEVGGHVQDRVAFSVNGCETGEYTFEEEPENRRGVYTPEWFREDSLQYGQRFLIKIDDGGTFLNGKKVSERGITYLSGGAPLFFTVRSLPHSPRGSIAIYGNGFGDWGRNMAVRMTFAQGDGNVL